MLRVEMMDEKWALEKKKLVSFIAIVDRGQLRAKRIAEASLLAQEVNLVLRSFLSRPAFLSTRLRLTHTHTHTCVHLASVWYTLKKRESRGMLLSEL